VPGSSLLWGFKLEMLSSSLNSREMEGGRSISPCLRRLLACALLFIGLAPAPAMAAKQTEVDVVVDFTPEGRQLQHPTVQNPAFYIPLPAGFQELGSPIGGEKQPSPYEVLHFIALQLSTQGYRNASPSVRVNKAGELIYADGTVLRVPRVPGGPGSPLFSENGIPLAYSLLQASSGPYSLQAASALRRAKPQELPLLARIFATVDPVHGPVLAGMPTIILTIHYGYMIPQMDDFGDGKIFENQNQMLGLVAGNTLAHLGVDFAGQDLIQKAELDRYFVMLTAFDYQAYVKGRKKVMLWQAKMSAPFHGLGSFGEVIPVLVAAGAPFFGRETVRPKILVLPVTPEGHVEIGTPTVKDYEDGPTPVPAGSAHSP